MPRTARRARKPMQEKWVKAPRGVWLKCTYEKCWFEWEYFGDRRWAECPMCHTTIKVAEGKRHFTLNKEPEKYSPDRQTRFKK